MADDLRKHTGKNIVGVTPALLNVASLLNAPMLASEIYMHSWEDDDTQQLRNFPRAGVISLLAEIFCKLVMPDRIKDSFNIKGGLYIILRDLAFIFYPGYCRGKRIRQLAVTKSG